MTRSPQRDLERNWPARELEPTYIWRRLSAEAPLLQAEKFQDLESRRSGESVDQGKPGQDLRTLLLLHDNDYCVLDHQRHPFSRFGAFYTD